MWPDGSPDVGAAGADAGVAGSGGGGSPPAALYPKKNGQLPPNSGDGYIGLPTSTCQGGVHDDGANCGGASCVAVGRDPPCGDQATYRAYFRFELAPLAGFQPKNATLKLYLWTKSSADKPAELHQIQDFGSLENSDWDSPLLTTFNLTFLQPTTPIGPVSQTVTTELLNALVAKETAIAFMLKSGDETQTVSSSHWYGIASADEDNAAPVIELSY